VRFRGWGAGQNRPLANFGWWRSFRASPSPLRGHQGAGNDLPAGAFACWSVEASLGCLGPQEGGAPCMSRQHGLWARMGMFLHWRLHAPQELARQSTGASCSFLHALSGPFASRTNDSSMRHASMLHAWAAWRHLAGLSAEGSLGGDRLSGLPLPAIIDRTDFPRGLSLRGRATATLERWRAAISPSRARWSGPLRL
jgi:hypothetical protein